MNLLNGLGHKSWKRGRPLASSLCNPQELSRSVAIPVEHPRGGERPPRPSARRVVLVWQRQRVGQQHGRGRRPRRHRLHHVTRRPRDRRGAGGGEPGPDRVPPGGVRGGRRGGVRVVEAERGDPDLDVVDMAQAVLPGQAGLVVGPGAEVAGATVAGDAGGGGAGGGRGRGGGGGGGAVGGALPPGHREGWRGGAYGGPRTKP